MALVTCEAEWGYRDSNPDACRAVVFKTIASTSSAIPPLSLTGFSLILLSNRSVIALAIKLRYEPVQAQTGSEETVTYYLLKTGRSEK